MEQNQNHIIFFDGVCGLCNGFIDFIMVIDKNQKFRFSPLQSEFASTKLPEELTKELKSVVYYKNDKIFSKSDAVIEVLSDIGGVWKLAALGKVFPKGVSNSVYDLVAEHRYRLFGKKETCRLPTPEERARFIS